MGCGPRSMSPPAMTPEQKAAIAKRNAENAANIRKAQEAVDSQQKQLDQAEKNTSEARAARDKAKSNEANAQKMANLHPDDPKYAKELEEAKKATNAAEKKVDQAEAAEENARRGLASAKGKLTQAKAKAAGAATGGGGGSFLSIKGEIKRDLLPFNPAGSGGTPVYSFRKNKDKPHCALQICPSSFFIGSNNYFRADIANSSVWEKESTTGARSAAGIDQNSILDNMPAIQFREYLQDTKLDTVLNIFSELGDIFSEDSADQSKNGKTKEKNGMFTKIAKTVKYIFSKEVIDLLTNVDGMTGAEYAIQKFSGAENPTELKYVLAFPYLLYYRLMGTTTTGYYTIPCTQNARVVDGDGTTGWESKDILALGGGAIVEKLTSFFNIGVHSTPMWDPKGIPMGTDYTVNFKLFNDSIDAAVHNYMFVNNVCANARPIQYHMFKHAPDLYDVKVEGGPRWYLCSGKFEVNYSGVSRKPSKQMVEKLMKYKNSKFSGDTAWMFDDNIIRIPDIYDVTCTFKSLLPENFNNYLYSFTKNNNIVKWTEMKSPNAIGEYISQCLKPAVQSIASYWKSL